MAKTRGGHSFRPRVRHSSPPLTDAAAAPAGVAIPSGATVPPGVVAPTDAVAPADAAALVAGQSTPPAAVAAASHAPVPATPAPCRYDTQVGPTPPSPHHPRLSRRALPLKRARTSSLDESSSSIPQEPHSPPVQGLADGFTTDLSSLLLSEVLSSIAAPS